MALKATMLSLHCNKSGGRFCIVIFPRWWYHTLAISGQPITTVSTLEWVSKCRWLFAFRSPHKIFLLASGSAHYKWTRLYMNKLKLPEGMSLWRVCQQIATSVFFFMSSNFLHICTYCKLVLPVSWEWIHCVNVELLENDFIIDIFFYILYMYNCMSTLLMSILNSSLLASVCLCLIVT